MLSTQHFRYFLPGQCLLFHMDKKGTSEGRTGQMAGTDKEAAEPCDIKILAGPEQSLGGLAFVECNLGYFHPLPSTPSDFLP